MEYDAIKGAARHIGNGLDEADVERGHSSIWGGMQERSAFSSLGSNLSVDVAIVGGGITGVTTAAELVRAGRTVALLEARQIGSGTTGHATGNLYALLDEGLHKLGKKWGDHVVEAVVQSRLGALGLIERNIDEHRIACDFERRPWVLYSVDGLPGENDDIEHEYNAAHGAGLDARLADDLPLPYMVRKALVVRNQAQFNPLAYVRQLAQAINSQQCRIFEDTPVVDIDTGACMVRTAAHVVRADHIVLATHTPKGFNVVQTELGPYREYAVAAPLAEHQLPGGIFWSIGARPTSTRAVDINGWPHVLMIGQKHKTGQNNDPDAEYRALEQLLRVRFDVRFDADMPAFRWSAQHYRAADGLPYIGSSPGASCVYLATGFSTDGLVYGTLAGMLIADEIGGVNNEFTELYSPRRFTPMKSAKNFLKENLNVAGRYIKDYTQSPVLKSLAEIGRGEGGLVEVDGDKLAAYRDGTDQLHVISPVCTHLKCIVQWNRAEHSWDCPCHGSRFNVDGSVIEGPALLPLHRHEAAPDIDLSSTPPV